MTLYTLYFALSVYFLASKLHQVSTFTVHLILIGVYFWGYGSELYISDITKSTAITNSIKQNEEFTAESNYENLKNNISMQTKFFEIALLSLGIVMALISALMLNSFAKITVLERKKEIAILKSLGASNLNILALVLFDVLVITLLSIAFALLLSIAYLFLIPLMLSGISYIKVTYPIGLLLLIGSIFIIFVCFYSVLSLQKLIKKMPSELIKQG